MANKSKSYNDVDWTAEQVDFTLRMLLEKIFISDNSFVIQEDFRYGHRMYNITNNNGIYVSLRNKSWIFMILNNEAAGSFEPSCLFWQDRVVKKTIKELVHALDNRTSIKLRLAQEETQRKKTETATRALFGAFPEAITKEFEKHVLELEAQNEKEERNDR